MLITRVLEREVVGCGVKDGTGAGIQLQEGRSQAQTHSASSPQDLQQLRQLFCRGRGIKKDIHNRLGHFKTRAVKSCQGWRGLQKSHLVERPVRSRIQISCSAQTQSRPLRHKRDGITPNDHVHSIFSISLWTLKIDALISIIVKTLKWKKQIHM